MPLFRGSKNATIVNGEIVATAQDIADAVNDAIAAKNAAELAETGAQTAENNAETAETNAETAETNAETAESGAVDAQSYAEEWANKPEDSLVSTDAGGDGVDDFSALHHANKASDSASAASTSESNAATSETNAQQAATDAETALDTFTDQYLGAKASDPATDNDGDPLQDGALYFNTSDNSLKVYSDSLSSWIVVNVRSDSNIRNLFSAGGDLTYNSTTGEFSFTERTDSEVRNLFSASGDLSYNAATGEFSFTETPNYTDADVDAHLSGGTGVTYTTGTIAIGQDVGTSASVTFLDAEFTGTGAVALPDGTQAQRPGTPLTGMLRFNTDLDSFEGYDGVEWGEIGGGNANDASISLSAGTGISGGGTFTTDQSADETISFSHADTSTQGSVNNSGSTVIQDVNLDGFGHVTSLSSATINEYSDSDALDLFNATGSAPVYACRAWVNFDGTGTVSIRESGNVSSITDNGTGDYTVNFATSMPDANYSWNINSDRNTAPISQINSGLGLPTSSTFPFFTYNTSLTQQNSAYVTVAIFR